MDRLIDALFSGLSYGAIYALVGLSLVVIFRGTGHLNFAQGEMATLSAYMAWLTTTWGVPIWLATVIAMAFGFVICGATEKFIVRPLARKSLLAVFVGTIALFLGINAFDQGKWGEPPDEIIPSIFPNEPTDFIRVFGRAWRFTDIGTLILTLVVTGLLFYLFQRTKFGLAMRAVASNPDSSRLVGVPTGRVLFASWAIAGAIGALAGVLMAGLQGQVTPILMVAIFVYGTAAAALGGLDSPGGAVIGGITIGIVENIGAKFAPDWIGQEMKLAVAMLAIFVVLIVRPSGLFGTSKVERV